jgi:probable addiction module antidote protein
MKNVTLSKFEPTDYLKTQEAVEAYLESAFETGDSEHIAKALGDAIKARGMMKTSKETGLDRSNLYDSFSKTGDPKLSTLSKVIDSLGFKISLEPKVAIS